MTDSDFQNNVRLWQETTVFPWEINKLSYVQLLTLNLCDSNIFGSPAKSYLLRQIGRLKKDLSKKARIDAQKEAETLFQRIKRENF